ncbi:hypothetical protein R1flu_002216 [Riccia fluitans]|uniref:Reverse transcriptase zinc-binding domain-containing protein n=1 Tax=Riccia fluitans TaxID=41844 RepID=A0ABD1Y5G2_9MARC
METRRLQDSASWRWKGTTEKWEGWIQPSQTWHKLISAEETTDDLASKWPVGECEHTLKERWKKLWGKGGAPRSKLWIWKILRRAFFTGEGARKMQVSTNPCCRCKSTEETVPHLFFDCRDSLKRWKLLQDKAHETHTSFQVGCGLLETVDEAIKTKSKGGILFYIVHNVTKAIWKDRNHTFFHNQQHATPLRVSLEQARLEIASSFNYESPETRWQHGLRALEEINVLISSMEHPEADSASSHAVSYRRSQVDSHCRSSQDRARPPIPEQTVSQSIRAAMHSASHPTGENATNDESSRTEFHESLNAPRINELQVKEDFSAADNSSIPPYSMRELTSAIERICSNEDLNTRPVEELEIDHDGNHVTRNDPTILISSSHPEAHPNEESANSTWRNRDHERLQLN